MSKWKQPTTMGALVLLSFACNDLPTTAQRDAPLPRSTNAQNGTPKTNYMRVVRSGLGFLNRLDKWTDGLPRTKIRPVERRAFYVQTSPS